MEVKINKGDLIELNEHRLLCASCTDPASYSKLIVGNEKIKLVLTDPPYGVGYVSSKKGLNQANKNLEQFEEIENDAGTGDFLVFNKEWLQPLSAHLDSTNAFYIFYGDTKLRELLQALNETHYHFSQLIIWNKKQAVMGRKDFQPCHELILYGWKGRHKYHGSKDKSIIDCPKPRANKLHPTMKPPELLRKLLYHSTVMNDLVFDGFAGSGSTLIACEHLGRRARVMEMEPKYCNTIVERYILLCEKMQRLCSIKINGIEIDKGVGFTREDKLNELETGTTPLILTTNLTENDG